MYPANTKTRNFPLFTRQLTDVFPAAVFAFRLLAIE
jgi:hypothetical protein